MAFAKTELSIFSNRVDEEPATRERDGGSEMLGGIMPVD
jgi:hypothetical protein